MEKLFLFLTIALDVYPWLFLQYLPFRGQLRLSFGQTLISCAAVLLLWQLGFVWIAQQSWYTLNIMLAWRAFQLPLLGLLTWLHIRSPFSKNAFVFGLLFPCTMLVLSFACFLMRFLPTELLPPYGVPSLLRLALSALLFPCLLRLWRHVLIPVMDV